MFPPEIIDLVFSFLHRDRATLKICARISPLAERHLYAQLTVQDFTSANPDAYCGPELCKLIHENPKITKYVRSLQINMLYPGAPDFEALDSVLPKLAQLETISLCFEEISIYWLHLPHSFRSAFTNCLQLPTLTSVGIFSINPFPLSVLDPASSLKRLSLSGNFYYPPSVSSIPHSTLDTLIVHNCFFGEKITSWLSTRNLYSLELKGDIGPLLKVCSDTLTTVKIHLHRLNRKYSINTAISFSHACLPHHLARLVVQSSISLTQCWSDLPDTMQLFDTFPSLPAALVFLLIIIDIDAKDSFDNVSAVDWSPLISFPFFDVIPRIELRVRAQKRGHQICSVKLLNTLKQDPHLAQLEKHRAFLITTTDSEENL